MLDAPALDVGEHRWPCESCGADLRFAPGATELKCASCGNVQAIPEAPESARTKALGELDLQSALNDSLPASQMEEPRATPCPACGAVVEFTGAAHAAACPFCATPVVIGTGTHRQIKPQALVPFQLTETQARAAMVAWLGSLWFAPNGLVEYTRRGRALDGLYTPYWTFDAATRSRYAGQRGDHYFETRTVTVNVNGKSQQRQEKVQKTRWSRRSGWVSRAFDDVLVLASTSLPQGYTQGLEPWDLTALKPYTPDYLAGFTAEGYTVALPDGHNSAREIMASQIRHDVMRDIGGDVQRIDSVDTAHSAETFKHILLPIWMAAYKFDGRTFRFVVNGQTGRVQGERPWSKWKIAVAVIVAAVVIGVGAYVWQMTQ
ncbi:MAG: zinc finger domain-containing protein [Gemmobacter sp.]